MSGVPVGGGELGEALAETLRWYASLPPEYLADALLAGPLAQVVAERDAFAAAVDRVRARHPRGDEEGGYLAPGLWCPTCGSQRADNGYGGCPDREALRAALDPQPADAPSALLSGPLTDERAGGGE